MKREILFRGKTEENGEWVYGSLDISGQTGFSHAIKTHDKSLSWNTKAVIQKTVGQLTGQTDLNGKKIFEDDICHVQNFYPEMYAKNGEWEERFTPAVGVIRFIYGCFMLCDHQEIPMHVLNTKNIEIIGNIHDNPELLK